MQHQHRIQFVNDEDMPEGHDFILVAPQPCGALILYRESAVNERVLEDSWSAYRALRRTRPLDPTAAPRWAHLLSAV